MRTRDQVLNAGGLVKEFSEAAREAAVEARQKSLQEAKDQHFGKPGSGKWDVKVFAGARGAGKEAQIDEIHQVRTPANYEAIRAAYAARHNIRPANIAMEFKPRK